LARAALLMIKRYGADAVSEAARRADELDQAGDPEGCATLVVPANNYIRTNEWCRPHHHSSAS
jgi:hypothetical protein